MWKTVAAAALAAALGAALQFARVKRLQAELLEAEDELRRMAEARREERTGRTKAERELRVMHFRSEQPPQQPALPPAPGADSAASVVENGEEDAAAASAPDHLAGLDLSRVPFPLRPIGVLRSCFSRRNGTPRQPLLVPAARAELVLRPDLSGDYLEGLGQYTHCWVLYIFHENTNLRRLWQEGGRNGGVGGQPAKVRVPRLDGVRLGVFATRTPHRPCPLGLSVARVLSVEGRTLVLGGADIVDGSPVLDIKPYVPFCDSLPSAAAPAWVVPSAEGEALEVGRAGMAAGAEAQLRAAWEARGRRGLYREGFEGFRGLVEEVLSRDIRSLNQRVKAPAREAAGKRSLSLQGDGRLSPVAAAGDGGKWHVILDGIDVGYDVDAGRNVTLRGAALLTAG